MGIGRVVVGWKKGQEKKVKNGKKKKKIKDDTLAPGCACGSGLLVVILTPLERGDRGASNGVKIIEIGVSSTELWMVINQSQKRFSLKIKNATVFGVCQCGSGSVAVVFGIVGKSRFGRSFWCQTRQGLFGYGTVAPCDISLKTPIDSYCFFFPTHFLYPTTTHSIILRFR
jgi:hypothetical protein